MVKTKRLKQVLSYNKERGGDSTLEFFDIKPSTLNRYKRLAREKGLEIGNEYDNPKILLLDIETSPIEAEIWKLGKQWVNYSVIKKPRSIITWSAKWLCDSEIMGEKVTPKDAFNRKDKKIMKKLWTLLEESDIIIGHNSIYFDEPIIKTRFILNNLPPVSPYQQIDTYRHSRKEFAFLSNKLDYLGKILANIEKKKTNRNLWTRCVNGGKDGKKALSKMLDYNQQDVRVLEEVYFKLRPWMHSHPNLGLYYEDMGHRCSNCGSKDLEINGNYYTQCGRYNAIRCNNCGAYGREKYSNITKEQRKKLLRSSAR